VRVHCAEVPAGLPVGEVVRWLRVLPPSRASRLARRLAAGTGLDSLTLIALLSNMRSDCRLPPISSLQWTGQGKPHFPRGPEISFTHSRGFAACGVAPRGVSIGIDLEPADRARDAAVRLVASRTERLALDDGSLSPTELWTAKEAVLKAAGAGLPDIRRVAVSVGRARFGGIDYGWRHYQPRKGLLLAVAAAGDLPVVDVRWPAPGTVFR